MSPNVLRLILRRCRPWQHPVSPLLEQMDKWARTPLFWAALNGHFDVMRLLVRTPIMAPNVGLGRTQMRRGVLHANIQNALFQQKQRQRQHVCVLMGGTDMFVHITYAASMYIYTYIRVHMCAYMSTYMNTYVCISVYVYIPIDLCGCFGDIHGATPGPQPAEDLSRHREPAARDDPHTGHTGRAGTYAVDVDRPGMQQSGGDQGGHQSECTLRVCMHGWMCGLDRFVHI